MSSVARSRTVVVSEGVLSLGSEGKQPFCIKRIGSEQYILELDGEFWISADSVKALHDELDLIVKDAFLRSIED